MHDCDVKWNDAPIPPASYFFTAEAYDKFSIAASFGEKLAAKEEDFRSAAKAQEEAAKQSASKQSLNKTVAVGKTVPQAAQTGPVSESKKNVPSVPAETKVTKQIPKSHPQQEPVGPATVGNKKGLTAADKPETGRSKKLAQPRYSHLSTAEQKTYLDLYQKYSKFIPNEPNKNEIKDIQKFKDLQIKVQAEQDEFQAYLERAAHHTPEVYQYMHPDSCQFMKEWLDVHRSRVSQYPRYYAPHESVSLEPPKILKCPPPFQHIQTLLQVGEVPKAILPNMNARIKPKVPVDYGKVKRRYPLLSSSINKKVCSQDENLEKLAKKYGAKIVLSSSSLLTLLDNQNLDKAWELPVVVKSYTTKVNDQEVTEKLVIVDKPFPKRNMNEHEKNLKFYRLALKAYLLHPGHMKSLRLDNIDQSHIHKRVVETTAQDSCFGGSDVDIAELETFGLQDMSPTRKTAALRVESGVSKSAKDIKDNPEVPNASGITDKAVVQTEMDSDLNGLKDSAEISSANSIKPEESVSQANGAETVKDSKDTPSTLRRSARFIEPIGAQTSISDNTEKPEVCGASDVKDEPSEEPKESKPDENLELKDPSIKKPRLSKSSANQESDSDHVEELSSSSRLTRASSRFLSPSTVSADSPTSEKRTPLRKSLRRVAESSPTAKKVDSGCSDSEKEIQTKCETEAKLSSVPVCQNDNQDKDLDDESLQGPSKDKDMPNTPRVTRRSGKRNVNPEQATELNDVESPLSPRRTRRSTGSQDNSASGKGIQQVTTVVNAQNEGETCSDGSQSESDEEEDKLIIDEPKDQTSSEESEQKTLTGRRTRSKATLVIDIKPIPAVSTRRSKRLSSEPIEEVEMVLTPKRTRSKDSVSSITSSAAGESTGIIAEATKVAATDKEDIISPASPDMEEDSLKMEIEESPASPTMVEADKDTMMSSPERPAQVKEIPLSPSLDMGQSPASPPTMMTEPEKNIMSSPGHPTKEILLSPSGQASDTGQDSDPNDLIKTSRNRENKVVGSTFDNIMKAQTVMLKTDMPLLSPPRAVGMEMVGPQVFTSVKGMDWVPTEKPTDFLSPETHNFTYNLWQLGNIPMIIRCSLHGNMRDKKQNLSYFSINPKLEYQYPYGVEQLTSSDICRAWISSYLRNSCSVVRARINVSNSELVFLEKLSPNRVLPPRSAFNPAAGLTVLHNIMESLLRLPEGSYLLSHTQDNPHVHIKQSVDRKGGVYDLHTAHTTYADIGSNKSPVVWAPVDPTIILQAHKFAGRVPATFDPIDSKKLKQQHQQVMQQVKKKKKKRKKAKPQTK